MSPPHTPGVAIVFGLREMPWLAFEESINRYRVIGSVLRGAPRLDSRTDRSRGERQGREQPRGRPRRGTGNESDSRRRLIFGGAHWSQMGRSGRLGIVVTLEQEYASINSQLLERRLLAQTHVEF